MLLLTGSDDYRLTQRKKFYAEAFVQKHPEGQIEYLDEKSDFGLLEDLTLTGSLFGEHQLIFAQHFWTPDKFETAEKTKFFDKIKNLSEITLIFIEPQLDKRKKFSKFLLKKAEVKTFDPLEESEIVRWVQDFTQQKNGQISMQDARFLLHRCGPNLWTLHQEIEKCLSATLEKQITRNLIEAITVPHPQTAIWDFLAKFSAQDKVGTLQQWQILLEMGESVHQVLAMVIREIRIHTLILSGVAQKMTAQEIATKTKLHPFALQKTQKFSQKFTREKLTHLYEKCYQIDKGVKTGKFQTTTDDQSEVELQIEKLILSL
jgi:DNA polymerase-3 subunit delta